MLRPYQLETTAAIINNYLKGIRQQVVEAGTGTGKTQIFAHLPPLLKDILPGQMLVLAHRTDLIDQAIEKIRKANRNLKVSKEMSASWADVDSDVIVASVASLGRTGTKRGNRFDWNKIRVVITDECHRASSQSYRNIYEMADVLRHDTDKLHIGFTATPQRADGRSLSEIYRKIVYSYPLRRAIEEGYLVDIRGVRVSSKTSLDGVKTVNGDFDQTSLSSAVNTPERNALAVKAWMDHSEGGITIGFTAGVQHAIDLAEEFNRAGVYAVAVWGEDPDRKDKTAMYRAGEILILLNDSLFVEGFDLDIIRCALLAKPTKSHVVFSQEVGRITRLLTGIPSLLEIDPSVVTKRYGIVIDITDNSRRHSLITLPTLMGLSAGIDLKGKSVVKAVQRLEAAQREHPSLDFSQLTDIDSIQTFVESVSLFDVKYPPEAENNSELSWHGAASGGYVLLLPGKEEVHIRQNLLDKYEVQAVIKGQKYKGERDTIEEAFSAADSLIQDKCPEVLKVVKREAPWHGEPATAAQLKLLAKLLKGKQIPLDIDKGKASRLISSCLAGRA